MPRPAGSVGDLSDPIVIGVVATAHGVRGALRVKPTGSGRHLREGVQPFVGEIRRRILNVRETPKGFLVDVEGIGDRATAAGLRGAEIVLDRTELDAPDEDEFYVGDLVGLEAYDVEGGEHVGAVVHVFPTPAHDVLVVWKDDEEVYVPFTLEHVPEVDLKGGRVAVKRPEIEG
ncbi:16S rRNA processing protein RimM [Rubrobacter marinus]|uniref:Ribosome maturation factor RimM n=1 Tax=Rubrobacter marinus TaxID=2653852 RepID=A0A6G8PXI8_9ACTN|nr:ribosome maturation factor RimM [Rubrobacter marinus]QIN78942.1 16S rRNA processing protein RimM [Rubrobacter marinus]